MQKLKLDSPGCTRFLEQFEDKDVPTARAILSNVRFISASEHVRWLRSRLERIGEQGSSPVAFLIVRQLKKNKNPFDLAGNPPGSEGRDAHIVKSITRSRSNEWFVSPSLQEMKDKKVRRIVLVCDTVGSGQEITNYATAVFGHTTIKSWISYGLIERIDVAACVVMDSGATKWKTFLRSLKFSQKVLSAEHLMGLKEDAYYNPRPITEHLHLSQDLLRDMLYAYTKEYLSSPNALGHGNSEGAVVFEPNVPNNLPGLLWKTYSSNWTPLFNGRSMDKPELFEEMDDGDWISRGHVQRGHVVTGTQKDLLDALSKTKSHTQLARRLGRSRPSVSRGITDLQAMGWVDDDYGLTREGRYVLKTYSDLRSPRNVAQLSPTDIYIPSVSS